MGSYKSAYMSPSKLAPLSCFGTATPADIELVELVLERYKHGFLQSMCEIIQNEMEPASSSKAAAKEREHFLGRTETQEEVLGWLCKLALHAPEEWYEILSGLSRPPDAKNDFKSIGAAFDASSRLRRAGIDFYHWKLTDHLRRQDKSFCHGAAYYIDRNGGSQGLVLQSEALPDPVSGTYRVVAISDTHLFHGHLDNLPEGDILIHAGDLCYEESRSASGKEFMAYKDGGGVLSGKKFLRWFQASGLPLHDALGWLGSRPGFQHRVLVGGNHDFVLEQLGPENAAALCKRYNVTYLHTAKPPQRLKLSHGPANGASVKVWGSGISFVAKLSATRSVASGNNAFQIPQDEAAQFFKDRVPRLPKGSVDIMVVHSPPSNGELLSKASGDQDHLGCFIKEVQPKLFVCGHAHRPSDALKGMSAELGSAGSGEQGRILGVNAACLGTWNQLHGYPAVIDMAASLPKRSLLKMLTCVR